MKQSNVSISNVNLCSSNLLLLSLELKFLAALIVEHSWHSSFLLICSSSINDSMIGILQQLSAVSTSVIKPENAFSLLFPFWVSSESIPKLSLVSIIRTKTLF